MLAGGRHRLVLGGRLRGQILDLIDDHSRLHLGCDAYFHVKAPDVVQSFHKACELHGLPESLLSHNGAVFVGGYRGGKVLLEYELQPLGIVFKNSRPYHPQTLGKVERLHQTLKRYLAKQPPAGTLAELQAQLDAFRRYYNHSRPHRALGRARPCRPTADAPRRGRRVPPPPPTSACARTRSMRPARSACAATRSSTKSGSGGRTKAAPSSC
ncbi:MAG: transposase family protein [Actinobacteria bacterium]|nr:MAG: transposase family protein [Actinomycetota bacterium]